MGVGEEPVEQGEPVLDEPHALVDGVVGQGSFQV